MILQTAILLNLTKKYSCIQNFRVQGKTRIERTVWPDLKGKRIKSGAGSSQ
jgi:hypothetical protein